MSGKKETYVSIPEREARRLREQEAKLRVVQSDLPQRLADIRESTMAEVRRQGARIDRRLDQIESTTNRLQSDLVELERDSQRRLREGLAAARSEYTNLVSEERDERLRREAQMRDEYNSLIQRERAERQRQITELQSRVTQIEDRAERLQQRAAAWLQDLRILQASVDELPHQRFSPGSMARINGHIEQAELNLHNDASEAALAQAQAAYFELIELRSEVLFKEQEFDAAYVQALEAVRSLLEEVAQNRQGVIPADQAEQHDIEVDIDFWSRGRLSRIQDRLREIETVLEKDRSMLTLDQVRRFEEEAVSLKPELVAAVEAARLAIINSQACYNVAEIVVEVMEEQGYSVEQGVYEGEDQREAYAIKMRNRGGDEFVSIITPSPERQLAYSTEMNFYDRNHDETMRQSFAQAVYEGLNQRGLEASLPRETLGVHEDNEQARNLEQFQRRKPQQREKTAAGN
jgi:hypothetical protein